MRSGLLTLIGTAVLVLNAFAQDQAAQTKYELIRETINFLATDNVVSQDTTFRISCETLDYDCFDQQLSGNPIAGIERWYNRWRAITVTDETGMVVLRDRLFADVLERQGKGYRKQLAGYAPYVARVEQLIDQYANGMQVSAAEITPDTTQLSADSLAAITYPANPEPAIDRSNNPEKENTMIAYLALAIGLIALIIVALTFFRKREPQPIADFDGIPERLDELMLRMRRLERQTTDSQTKEAITSLTDIMEAIEKRVVMLEDRSKLGGDK